MANPTPETELEAAQRRAREAEEERDRTLQEMTAMKNNVANLMEQVNNLAEAQPPAANQGTVVAKTEIKTPKLEAGMTFRDYKYEVEMWTHYASKYYKKADMAWMLINQLPAVDDRMIKKTCVENIGKTNLSKDNAVQLLLDEMQKLLECEPFTRLVEWLKEWETLNQGSKSYEKYTTQLRRLVKTAEDDFKFVVPEKMRVAKLLLGCRDVKGSNIGLITGHSDLNGEDSGLYAGIEAKVRAHLGTTEAFSGLKAGGSNNHHVLSQFQVRDVFGNPIVTSPVKQSPDSPFNRLGPKDNTTEEEDYKAFIAFRRQQNHQAKAGGQEGRNKGSETQEERKARLISEQRCFEYNCESKDHLFEDCPKRKLRLERKRARVLASGGQWFDTPAEAKRHKEAKKVSKNHIAFNLQPETEPDYEQELETAVMDEFDEQEFAKIFKTKRILMAQVHTIDPSISRIHYSEMRKDEALMDSGCEKTCSGVEAYDNYVQTLSDKDKADIREYVGKSRFKFGAEEIFTSLKEAALPFYIAGRRKILKVDVVSAQVPLLIGLPVLKQLELGMQYSNGGQDYAFYDGVRFRVYYRQGHHYMRISHQGSIDSIDEAEHNKPTFATFMAKAKVFDPAKVRQQLKQLHTNYAHLPHLKMIQIIKDAGQYEPQMEQILEEIMSNCPVKRCRTKDNTQAGPKAAFHSAKRLGDLVSVDLKIRASGKHIMYLVDYATNFVVAGLIQGKSSLECARVLVQKWYGAGLPRIATLLSDNGLEFTGESFVSILKKFSTLRKLTTPFHPASNGLCERVHSVVDINMAKLQEADSSLSDEAALTWAVMAYNYTPTYTGFAPGQLVFGLNNVLIPAQDLTVVECQDNDDAGHRYLKELKAREEAIINHNVIRNSRRLRELLHSRSRPTPQPKPVGSWVWYWRHNEWQGPAQVGHSLGSECSVREGNQWYNCKHAELLPLNAGELQRFNLEQNHEPEPQATEVLPEPIESDTIQLEVSLPQLLSRKSTKPPGPQVDASEPRNSDPSRGGTRKDSQPCDLLEQEEAGSSQSPDSSSPRSGAGTRNSSQSSPEQGSEHQAGQAGQHDSSHSPNQASQEPSISDQSSVHNEPPPQQEQNIPPVVTAGQSASVDPSSQARDELPRISQETLERPPIDVREMPLRKNEEVRIVCPQSKNVVDVKILNGFKKPSQKSWYRILQPDGTKSVLDFNEICWDYKPSHNYHTKAIIQPGKTLKAFHTVIHPKFHKNPAIIEAKHAEIQNHIKFGTFEILDVNSLTPKQKQNIIPSTWAVVWKGTDTDGKYKARLCARGDLEPNVDEIRTDAPTSSKDFIRLLLTVAASNSWKLHSLDFTAAFIQGKTLDRELFMNPPPDIRAQNPGKIFKIIKRLYGLKDASRGWCTEIRDHLIQAGMKQSAMDKAVFFQHDAQGQLSGLVITHIDDFLYAGTPRFHETVIKGVQKRYVIGSVEDTRMTFTGWELSQTQEGITLKQDTYADSIKLEPFEHFRRFTAKDEQILGENDQTLFRKMVGILNWLVTSSRPGLAHACNKASASLGKATRAEAKAVLRTLEKVKGEKETLKFSNLGPCKNWELEVFSDAALGRAADPETYIGNIAFIKGKGLRNVLNWHAGKLNIPTASILDAESEGVTESYGKIKYFRFIFQELFGSQIPATIHTDSKSLHQTVLSDNSIRNRRISAAVATIRAIQVKVEEQITLHWVKGLANLSDPLTKPNANLANLKNVLRTGKTLPEFPVYSSDQ